MLKFMKNPIAVFLNICFHEKLKLFLNVIRLKIPLGLLYRFKNGYVSRYDF